MSVGEVCIREVVVLTPEASVAEAARLMRKHHVGDVVIVEGESQRRKPIGVVTDRDIVLEIVAEGLDPAAIAVGEVMTRAVETIAEKTNVLEAVRRMRVCGVRRMPVVDEMGVLLGIFTLDDALGLIGECIGDLTQLVEREIKREQKGRPIRASSGNSG
jgi:CBS domain-containing protein